MRRLARPGLRKLKGRLREIGSRPAVGVLTTLLDANAEFMAYALSKSGPLGAYAALATARSVESCFGSLLVYSLNLFAREDFAQNDSELVTLLASILGLSREQVMLRRDALRKTPRSEEWMLYAWLLKDLGAPAPAFDPRTEASFGYQYVGYMNQYRGLIEERLSAESPPAHV